jgi:hypothetical protein
MTEHVFPSDEPVDRTTILTIVNSHYGKAPDLGTSEDRWVSYWQNEAGEQFLFIQEHGKPTATLYGGDLGWDEPHEIREHSPAQIKKLFKGIDAATLAMVQTSTLLPEIILGQAEQQWLRLCWDTSAEFRK